MFNSKSLCFLLMLLILSTNVEASSQLRSKLALMANNILKNTKNEPVRIGQFSPTGRALKSTNSGPGIEGLLIEQLKLSSKRQDIISDDARYEVKGDYALIHSRQNPQLREIKIIARIIETEFGEELKELRVLSSMDGTSTIGEIVQSTINLDPNGTKTERNKKLIDKINNPSVHISGANNSIVSSTSASPYGVEIYTKPLKGHQSKKATSRTARVEQGMAYVDIHKDDLYEVKLYNNSNRPVAAKLLIDGLDMFHFSIERNSHGAPAYTHMIIQPHKSTTIVGWFQKLKAPNNYLSFLVTDYGKGAVSKAGISSRGNVGVIHAQFSYCFPLTKNQKARSGNETGFGPSRSVQQRAVRYEIEPPFDFVSVRYTKPQQ